MIFPDLPELCGINGCRLLKGHQSPKHNPYPTSIWDFMQEKDRKKIDKSGYATPRGGKKGAYQNHVNRNNRVIIPYEKLSNVPLEFYEDGYIIRLYPEQYFESQYQPFRTFIDGDNTWIIVGENAFILYRTHKGFEDYPPLPDWSERYLLKDGQKVNSRRGNNVIDGGHYVCRISKLGEKKKRMEGVDQGVFAPEYANKEINFLSQCVLAWLIIHTLGSPYVTTQAKHLQAVLAQDGLLDDTNYEHKGVIRHGLCACPLCLKFLKYQELHELATYEDSGSHDNAPDQIEGAARSTVVNLFHLEPLVYDYLAHLPSNIAWGHHTCNTRLGQRRCYSLQEMIDIDLKVGILKPEGIETFGWISNDYEMIRSPLGSVWIRISRDEADELPEIEGIESL